jgi:protein TonB
MRIRPFILSFLAHAAMIGLAVVVGLHATTGLPDPPRSMSFIMVAVHALDVQAPPARRLRSSAPAANPDAAPVGKPDVFAPDQRDLPDAAPDGADAIVGAGDPAGDLFGTIPPPPALRVGGVVRPPQKLHHVAPVYPEMAQSAHVTGTVILEALIAEDGSVGDVKVLRSVALLDSAAVEAVRQWRFTPTLLNGVPVQIILVVTIAFTLK